jgi:hypothetical protein
VLYVRMSVASSTGQVAEMADRYMNQNHTTSCVSLSCPS